MFPGFLQVEGAELCEKFAMVVKFTCICLLLAILTKLRIHLHQIDVVTAFHLVKMYEKVYSSSQVFQWVVRRKQCAILIDFYTGSNKFLVNGIMKLTDSVSDEFGMTRNTVDLCLYGRHILYLLMVFTLYVVDLLISSNAGTVLEETK